MSKLLCNVLKSSGGKCPPLVARLAWMMSSLHSRGKPFDLLLGGEQTFWTSMTVNALITGKPRTSLHAYRIASCQSCNLESYASNPSARHMALLQLVFVVSRRSKAAESVRAFGGRRRRKRFTPITEFNVESVFTVVSVSCFHGWMHSALNSVSKHKSCPTRHARMEKFKPPL